MDPGKSADAVRRRYVRRVYGEYGVELERRRLSGEGCSICGSVKRVVIDHDHQTGVTRGLICTGCNGALGAVRDRPELLELLAEYLRRHHGG